VIALGDVDPQTTESMDFLGSSRWVLNEAVELAFALDDLESVRRQLDVIAARVTPVVAPITHAFIHRFRARLAALEDRHDDVTRNAQAAIDTFQQRQLPFWLAVTRLELAEWMVQRGKSADAEEMLTEARATFVDLAASPWIERAAAAARGETIAPEQTALPA
jgi:hypothetical protein